MSCEVVLALTNQMTESLIYSICPLKVIFYREVDNNESIEQ
jgi:hypothetical protein